MKKPLVSVLIPMYKRAELVFNAVDCILNQDYQNIEIIIGDNKSEDGSFELIYKKYKDYKNIILFQNDSNLGPVKNWINCLERANGEYIKILWSDDLISKNYISECIKWLERYPDASFAYSAVRIFKKEDEFYNNESQNVYFGLKKTGIYNSKVFIDKVYKNSYSVPVSPGCAIFRRGKIKISTHIDNSINYDHNKNGAGTDLLIFLNSLSKRDKFIYINKTMSYFRYHEGSISVKDSSINDGYYTAKLSYLKKNNLMKYCKDLNSEIISSVKGRHCFNSKNNKALLKKYYENDEKDLINTSGAYIFLWLLRWYIYNKKNGIK